MSISPILNHLHLLDMQIAYEEEKIHFSLIRIKQLKKNFMMNQKIKSRNIKIAKRNVFTFMMNHKRKSRNLKIAKRNIFDSKQKILEFKAKKAIIYRDESLETIYAEILKEISDEIDEIFNTEILKEVSYEIEEIFKEVSNEINETWPFGSTLNDQ